MKPHVHRSRLYRLHPHQIEEAPLSPLETPNFDPETSAKIATLRFPGYLSQIIGFILQFPSISLDFYELGGHKF